MNLTGIQIFKYLPAANKLPNGNCKKCGCATCMAFALKLAQKQIDIKLCPNAPAELIDKFVSFSKIQQNTIKLSNNVLTGGETVMFRHEKTFVNKTVIAIKLETDDVDFDDKLSKIANYQIERVGEVFKVEAIYLVDNGNLEEKALKVHSKGLGLIIKSSNISEAIKKLNPIIELSIIYKDEISVVSGKNIDEIRINTSNALNITKNIIIDLAINEKKISDVVEELTQIRRLAILNRDENFAHPVMTKLFNQKNEYEALAKASLLLCRYSNIIVLDIFDEAMLTALYTLRQGIYTDPQKPLQVEAKVYEINEPDENSVVLVTTNFALTYFAVANELESSGIPAYLIVTPSDGMSVLTAWSADKFNSEIALKAVVNSGLKDKVKRKEIIIPGLLADMKEELEDVLDGWDIIVGTNEAYNLPDFINSRKSKV